MRFSALRLFNLSFVHRYLAIIRFKITRVLVFRTEMLIWVLLSFLPFAILLLIWQELFAESPNIQGFTLSDISSYYLISALITNLTDVHFEGWRSEEIRLGRIDRFLTKPYYYLTEIGLGESVGKALYATVFLPLYLLFIGWTTYVTGSALPNFSVTSIALFLFLLLLAFLIQMLLGMIITLLSFWLEGAQGLEHVKWIAITMLSGTLMPLAFLPSWLQTLTNLLPFKYLYVVPITVLQGSYSLQWVDLFKIAITIAILYSFVHWLWHKGVARYCSAGG